MLSGLGAQGSQVGAEARHGLGRVADTVDLAVGWPTVASQDDGHFVAERVDDVGPDIGVGPIRVRLEDEVAHRLVPPAIVARLVGERPAERPHAIVDDLRFSLLLEKILAPAGEVDGSRAQHEGEADEARERYDDPHRGIARQLRTKRKKPSYPYAHATVTTQDACAHPDPVRLTIS